MFFAVFQMDHFVFLFVFSRINGNGRTDIEKTRTDIEKTRTDIENTKTHGRTDARNFAHRGERVCFGDDPLFLVSVSITCPLRGALQRWNIMKTIKTE